MSDGCKWSFSISNASSEQNGIDRDMDSNISLVLQSNKVANVSWMQRKG
jgi:hypothetical protein